jgi:hypothetical protein
MPNGHCEEVDLAKNVDSVREDALRVRKRVSYDPLGNRAAFSRVRSISG